MKHLYSSQQPHLITHAGNSICDCFNCTIQDLLKTPKTKKMNWSLYFPSLTFAYNATPNGTTGFQP